MWARTFLKLEVAPWDSKGRGACTSGRCHLKTQNPFEVGIRDFFTRSHTNTMPAAMLRALLSLTILRGSLAEVPADEIKSLPGWSGPLPSRMWSGHIDGGSDVQDGVAYSMKMWYMSVFARLPPQNTGVRPKRSPQTRTLTPIPKRRTNPNQTGTWSARRARTPRRRPPCCGRMGAPARPQPTACSQNLGHSRCRTSLCARPL